MWTSVHILYVRVAAEIAGVAGSFGKLLRGCTTLYIKGELPLAKEGRGVGQRESHINVLDID